MKAPTKAIRFLESLSIPEGLKAGQAVILLDDYHTNITGPPRQAVVTGLTFMRSDPPQPVTGCGLLLSRCAVG